VIKLLVCVANDRDACGYYRALSPFSLLAKQRKLAVQYCVGTAPNYAEIRAADILFFVRPTTPGQVAVIETAHQFGVPVIVDWDDDAFNVPSDNPTFDDFNKEQNVKAMAQALRLADVVTVTTDALAQALKPRTDGQVAVVKNAIDPSLFKLLDILPKKREQKIVMWRGSRTHDRDLRVHTDGILAAAKKYPDVMFVFIGFNPWWITEAVPNASWTPAIQPIWQYFGVGRTIGPDVMIVPLADNLFNRAKSEIGAVEGSLFGALSVSPAHWGISKGPFGYGTPDAFANALDAALWVSNDFRRREAKVQFETVRKNFDLAQENAVRAAIIDSLAK
jgi:O-antigen biosynthesis protein